MRCVYFEIRILEIVLIITLFILELYAFGKSGFFLC